MSWWRSAAVELVSASAGLAWGGGARVGLGGGGARVGIGGAGLVSAMELVSASVAVELVSASAGPAGEGCGEEPRKEPVMGCL